jgi:hypothetical protein
MWGTTDEDQRVLRPDCREDAQTIVHGIMDRLGTPTVS